MSNFSPSNLVAGQATFNEKFISGEWRLPDIAAFKTAMVGGVANPMLVDLHTREDRAVEAYFPIRQAATNGTSRTALHIGARGDSLAEAITWATFSEPFSISIKQADNNIFSWDQMFASTLRNAILNLMNRIDAAHVSQLVAAKTGVNAGGGNGVFNGTVDVYEIPLAEENFFYQNSRETLNFNLYRNQLIGIVDSKAFTLSQRLREQGSANATNFGFQFDGMDIFGTTRTILGGGYGGSGLFFEAGLSAVIPWIPKQNRKALNPMKILDNVGDFGQIEVPEFGFPFAISAYSQREDNTSKNSVAQDVTIEYEVSIDMGFVNAPLSDVRGADDEVIYAVGQLVA